MIKLLRIIIICYLSGYGAEAVAVAPSESFFSDIASMDREENSRGTWRAYGGASAHGLLGLVKIPVSQIAKFTKGNARIFLPKALANNGQVTGLVYFLRQRGARRININELDPETIPGGVLRWAFSLGRVALGDDFIESEMLRARMDYSELVIVIPNLIYKENGREGRVSLIAQAWTDNPIVAAAKNPAEFGHLLKFTGGESAIATDDHFRMAISVHGEIHAERVRGQPVYSEDEIRALKSLGQPLVTFKDGGDPVFLGMSFDPREEISEMTPARLNLNLDRLLGQPMGVVKAPGFSVGFHWVLLGPYRSLREISQDPVFLKSTFFENGQEIYRRLIEPRLNGCVSVLRARQRSR